MDSGVKRPGFLPEGPVWPWTLPLLFGLCLLAAVLFWGNVPVFLFVNQHLTPELGQVARPFSWLGESLAMGLLLAASFWINRRMFFQVGLTWFVGACFSWLFKLWLLKGLPRPLEYFQRLGQSIETVAGIKTHHLNSFPSGHTLTAFSAAILLGYLFPRKPGVLALAFGMAGLCGLSRVVLAQHWPGDVLGGAVLGIAAGLVSGPLLKKLYPPLFLTK